LGDCCSNAARLVHRARNGEIVISLDLMKALKAKVETLGAEELPVLELGGKRPALPIYGMVLETRLDFTETVRVAAWRMASASVGAGYAPETPCLRSKMNVGT